jgi:hypothetical protein
LDEVLAANKAYLASGQHTPDMKLGVSRRLVVLTCMDSRCGGDGGGSLRRIPAPPPARFRCPCMELLPCGCRWTPLLNLIAFVSFPSLPHEGCCRSTFWG